MHSIQARMAFAKSEKGQLLREQLESMVKNPIYNTKIYSLTSDFEGTQFIDKHMNYMSRFPKLNHLQYVANLRLMTKIVKR